MNLSDFQKQLLGWCRHGCGVDASPREMSAKERREANVLVDAGILRKTKNHSGDKNGMYVITETGKTTPQLSTQDSQPSGK